MGGMDLELQYYLRYWIDISKQYSEYCCHITDILCDKMSNFMHHWLQRNNFPTNNWKFNFELGYQNYHCAMWWSSRGVGLSQTRYVMTWLTHLRCIYQYFWQNCQHQLIIEIVDKDWYPKVLIIDGSDNVSGVVHQKHTTSRYYSLTTPA